MSDAAGQGLIHNRRESYGSTFSADFLEQYKLYVQSAENVSARRVASSNYLLTLNMALVALYGFQSAGFGESFWALAVPLNGIASFPAVALDHQVAC